MSVARSLLPLVLAAACGTGSAAPSSAVSAPAPAPRPSGALPVRAEAVAEADALAVAASRASGDEAITLNVRAAEMRTRLWRVEHRETDALEALELYRGVETRPGESACLARIERALLEGELRGAPADTFARVYRVKAGASQGPCRDRADRVLATLGAFRPLPNVLTEIDRQARGADAGAGDSGVVGAGDPAVRIDAHGPVVMPAVAKRSGPVRITNIERYGAKDAARVVVFVTHPTVFDVGFIPAEGAARGPRLYVDIDGAAYKGPLEHKVGGLVERVRIGKRDKGTRVVLDLGAPAQRKVFYLPEPFRLVIDVSTEAAPTPAPAGAAAAGPRPLRRVVLDPGHGGHDPGAVGPAGLREKDVTLDVAHRAAPILARELGVSTLLTRDSDDFVALDARTARANAFQADLFVSIHCNASEDPSARGFMTFVLDDSRDALASAIAARENAASAAAAAELANAMSRVLDAGSVSRSVHLADLIQKAAHASFSQSYSDEPDGGVKRAGFYVLAGARMPAVLFETSFISNPTGESRLNTGDYRQKLADAIVNAVRAYKEGR